MSGTVGDESGGPIGGRGPREAGAWVVFAGVAAGLGLRLLLAWGPYGNYDQTSWQIVAEIVGNGGNVYAETHRYNYAPVWAGVVGTLLPLARVAGLEFHFVVRAFLTLVDLADAILIGLIAAAVGRGSRGTGMLAYALNPVAIMIVGYHGQFDNLAALPLLAATLLAVRRPGRPPVAAIWALATVALLTKHLCVFSVWTLLVFVAGGLLRPALLFLASIAVFLASFAPFLPEGWSGVVGNVVLYAGIPHPYGLPLLLPRTVVYAVFVTAMALFPLVARSRRLPLVQSMELAAVLLLVFIPGVGEAYFLLPALWGSLRRPRGWWVFLPTAYVFLLHGPNNLQALFGVAPWNAVWVALVYWLADAWATRRRESAASGGERGLTTTTAGAVR